MAPKVLVSDKLSETAVQIFRDRGIDVDFEPGLGKDKDRLLEVIGQYDGLAIRSATKVTEKILAAADNLKVIGRAGIGVDNVDREAASKKGVIVMNTPFGNMITTAEHAIAMMMAVARQIPEANASTHAGKWEKSRFMGVELTNKTLGVIGAGMMGAGIALVSALAGIKVVLIDSAQDTADKGKAYTEAHLDKGIARKKVTPEKKEAVLGLINATTDYDVLKGCDLIVEAVFEDMGVKAEVTKKVEAVVGEDCIFATNTSTLPISELAKASARPEQFIGIHFFSPVDKMLLVEIIKGRETDDVAVAKALDFVRQIRKTPIVVNDARFFYANRCIIPYINEGIRMVKEGVEPALIENAAKLVGMPLGPLQLVDETSVDLGVKIAKATRAAMGGAYPDGAVDEVLFWMADEGRLGRKANAGFYEYDEKGKRGLLWEGLEAKYPVADEQPSLVEVQHRLLFAQVLEGVRALEDGVLEDIREGDVGAILGWGFAPWSGGPFSWLDIIGTPYAAGRCDQLTAAYGERFKTPELLREMAAKGQSFYGRFGKTAQAA